MIAKCMGFARKWGFDLLDVVNLYARSGFPRHPSRLSYATGFVARHPDARGGALTL